MLCTAVLISLALKKKKILHLPSSGADYFDNDCCPVEGPLNLQANGHQY
jgi:hypothetical protein